MIRVVDYGLGNVQALLNVYKRLGIPADRATCSTDLADSKHIILPGVGSFDHAMQTFNSSGMRDPLENRVSDGDTYILGICVGMQILGLGSDEGTCPGLGWVPGFVRSFDSVSNAESLPMPHMGWNDIQPEESVSQFFAGAPELGHKFYFLHSYYFECDNAEHVAARTSYGINFASAVKNGGVIGVQFHPEKSHSWGVNLLMNFANL